MNFQQLRIIRETVRRNFNLTEVANALFTSQPGVSKHIKDLEDELGIELFIRKGKRLLGLTEPGKELAEINAYWSRLVFSGKTTPPRQAASSQEVLDWLSTHKGAIGYIERSRLDARFRPVLDLSGHSP